MANTSIIKKPWITEKATASVVANQYIFIVQTKAAKPEVKKAIEALYKVNVVAVNMINRATKNKRFGGNRKAPKEGYRKAIVTIKDGQKIDFN